MKLGQHGSQPLGCQKIKIKKEVTNHMSNGQQRPPSPPPPPRTPSRASASMLAVRMARLPSHPMHSPRCWSAMMKRMFGRSLRRARGCAGFAPSPGACIDAVAATAILNTSLRLSFPSFDFATSLPPLMVLPRSFPQRRVVLQLCGF